MKAALLLAVFLVILVTALPAREGPGQARVPISLAIEPIEVQREAPAAAPLTMLPERLAVQSTPWQNVDIKPGDSLSAIFKRMGVPAADLVEIVRLGADVASLRKILPGKQLGFHIEDGRLEALRYEENELESLIISRADEGFAAYREVLEPEILTSFQTATISDETPSLYHAGKKAGLSDNIIMELSNIFQWDISFALDLRKGDSFALLYEEVYVEGEKVKEGDILAAQFTNMGTTHRAVLYETASGRKSYYAPDGRSMRKAFLRDPVHFKYVSSSFNLNRLHPIHKRVMPHRGIDYAAQRGTPVVASGDGRVLIARQNNASGRYVVIQHGEQYQTKYLHLSGFAKGIRPGKDVSQGQTIGYVGATGWATAPHLHYEFLVNGVHRNPRTVELPKAEPIGDTELDRFKAQTSSIIARLDSVVGNTSYAFADEPRGSGEE
ncbi:MAG: peptidoglycan DD-metalloendopeptidase family protein [Pseudomonadales bacterium]|nr:peptidoglycan DD-metalloendopeptidase family protein [Pseudomonadales bacterium]